MERIPAKVGVETAGGGVILGPGARTVWIEKKNVSLINDLIQSHPPCPDDSAHCTSRVIQGSSNVFVENKNVTREFDPTSCGHSIEKSSSSSVFINTGGQRTSKIINDLPPPDPQVLERIKQELIKENSKRYLLDELRKGKFSLKDSSITLDGLKPQADKIILAAIDVFPSSPVITSTSGDVHMPGSKHYTGEAIDLRLPKNKTIATKNLQEELGDDYDVILESDHIHVEYDPKNKVSKTDKEIFG